MTEFTVNYTSLNNGAFTTTFNTSNANTGNDLVTDIIMQTHCTEQVALNNFFKMNNNMRQLQLTKEMNLNTVFADSNVYKNNNTLELSCVRGVNVRQLNKLTKEEMRAQMNQ